MNTRGFLLAILLIIAVTGLTGCPAAVDEEIKENVDMHLSDLSIPVDNALQISVEQAIKSDFDLQWYAERHPEDFKVEVSHAVAVVYMRVRTEEERDRALELARGVERVTEVIDEIKVDPAIDEPPFDI
ncbi:MAG TPA: BON domain-containing protein [bacterium]